MDKQVLTKGGYSPPSEQKQRVKSQDTECGLGSCRPSGLQCCAAMGCFTGVYGLSGLVTSSLQIYINSQITTLERQFGFSSSVSGLILSSNDIGFLLTTIFMSYIARRTHIPRVLALSTMFFGFSGLICSIPHFMDVDSFRLSQRDGNITALRSGPIQDGAMCLNSSETGNSTDLQCASMESVKRNDAVRTVAIVLLSVGMCLQGFGKSPRYPFLATYVDDNVEQTKTPLYLGIISSIGIFGPALGFTLGGVFSKMYVTLEETDMSLRDPRWIGAWWLGFIFFGGIAIVAALPLLCFPKKMRTRPQHLDKLKKSKKLVVSGNKCQQLTGLLKSVLRLISNPIYICCCLSVCVMLFSISGMLAFLPKYLESHFQIPAWKANILLGTINVFGAASGTLTGGLLTSKLKLTPMTCLKLVTAVGAVSCFIMATGFAIACPRPNIIQGTSRRFMNDNQNNSSLCDVSTCGCDDERYFPVCGADNQNYFSPCHAGCSDNINMMYTNCTCVEGEGTAVPGLCAQECSLLWYYVAFNFIGAFVSTLVIMPNFVVSVRCIRECDKPLGIGLSAFLTTLLGWFPGPVVYGKVIDTTCLVWSFTCSGKGACSMYDSDDLRIKYHVIFLVTKIISTLFYVVALVVALRKKKPFFVDEKPEVTEVEVMIVKKNTALKTKGTKV